MTGLPFTQCDFKAENNPRCREVQATVNSSARYTPDGVNTPTRSMPTASLRTRSQNRLKLQIPMLAPESNESCRVDAGGVRRLDSSYVLHV